MHFSLRGLKVAKDCVSARRTTLLLRHPRYWVRCSPKDVAASCHRGRDNLLRSFRIISPTGENFVEVVNLLGPALVASSCFDIRGELGLCNQHFTREYKHPLLMCNLFIDAHTHTYTHALLWPFKKSRICVACPLALCCPLTIESSTVRKRT